MEITDVVGEFGPWQKVILFVAIYRAIPHAVFLLAAPVLVVPLKYRCVSDDFDLYYDDDNITMGKQCTILSGNETFPCEHWEYDLPENEMSVNMQFDLVCDRQWLGALVHTVYIIGNFFGLLFSGNLSDRFGRKPTVLSGIIIMVVTSIAGLFSWTFYFFLITRILTGFGAALVQNSILCLYTETVGPKQRDYVALSFISGFAVGYILLGLFSWKFGNWKYIQLLGTVLSFLLFLMFLILVPESPRWLLTVGQDKRAEKVIEAAARKNHRLLVNREVVFEALKNKIEQVEKNRKTATLCDLFRNRSLRKILIFLSFLFISMNFSFYFVHLNSAHFGAGLHLTIFLMGIVELISIAPYFLITKYFFRKFSIIFAFFLCGITSLGVLAIPKGDDYAWIKLLITLAAKISLSINFALIWMYSAELLPTSTRSAGIDFAFSLGRLGNLIPPFIVILCERTGFPPLILISILSIVSGIVVFFMPETKLTKLTDTVGEAEKRFQFKERPESPRSSNQEERV